MHVSIYGAHVHGCGRFVAQEQQVWIQTLREAIKWAPERPVKKPSDQSCKECGAEFSLTKWCSWPSL